MRKHLYDPANPMGDSNGLAVSRRVVCKNTWPSPEPRRWSKWQSVAYLLATTLIIIALLSGCTPQQKAVWMDYVDHLPSTPKCTATHHEWPCKPDGDNEPTVGIPPHETVVRIGTAIHQQCQEDMPCWDCHTMGNHICGPQKGK